jgi:cellulose biosynthesis protein BcsQ
MQCDHFSPKPLEEKGGYGTTTRSVHLPTCLHVCLPVSLPDTCLSACLSGYRYSEILQLRNTIDLQVSNQRVVDIMRNDREG